MTSGSKALISANSHFASAIIANHFLPGSSPALHHLQFIGVVFLAGVPYMSVALYFRKDLTREKYAVSLSFSGQPFRLRLRKDNLEFALDVMTSMCFVHFKSSLTVTPRYLASFTSSSTCPDNSYSNSQIKKSQSWRTLVININSAPGKRAELENLINYTDPDLIIMTETKIDEQVKASKFLPKGYTGDIRKDRCKGGGGVMIATKQEYDIQGIELEANISAETVWATISLKDQRKLVVGSYYRPPDSGSDSIDDLESVLSFITEKFRNNPQCTIILGGDFNAGDIDWESHTVCEHSLNRQINEKILSVISSSGLVQIQKDFTRNDKILDLLCTNKPDLFSDIRSIPGISDHEIILADCDLKPVVCKKPPRTIYLWNKVDWNKIRLLASEFSESFLPEHGTRSVDKNYTMFKEFIALTMKEHIPNKLTSTRTNLPWFNRGLKRMCKRRRFKRAKKSKKSRDWERYVAHKRQLPQL